MNITRISSLIPLKHSSLTGQCQKYLEILIAEKRSKSGNFRANLVEFRVDKCSFLFETQCYI